MDDDWFATPQNAPAPAPQAADEGGSFLWKEDDDEGDGTDDSGNGDDDGDGNSDATVQSIAIK